MANSLYKLAFLLNYFTDVYLVVDGSTVAIVGAVATATIGYIQYHYGHQAALSNAAIEGRLNSLETKVDEMSKSMVTKADLKADLKSPCPTAISGRYPR